MREIEQDAIDGVREFFDGLEPVDTEGARAIKRLEDALREFKEAPSVSRRREIRHRAAEVLGKSALFYSIKESTLRILDHASWGADES